MANSSKKEIVVEGWSGGIGSSPHTGFQEMYNCDVFNVDGIVKPNFQMFSQADVPIGGTFGYTTGGNTLVLSTSINRTFNSGATTNSATGVAISFSGTVPTGLTAGVIYYAITVSTLVIEVATTIDNALASVAISLSGASIPSGGFATIAPHLMTQFAQGSDALYGIDSSGYVWEQDGSGLWYLVVGNTSAGGSSAAGNGIVFWQNYLLVFDDSTISTWGPFTSARASRSWTNSWQALVQSNSDPKTHSPFIQSSRPNGGTLYWGDYNDGSNSSYPVGQAFIGSLTVTPGDVFAPGTSGTFNFNQLAFVVPFVSGAVTCLENFSDQLAIGTASSRIYLWDLTSQNPTAPLFMPETTVQAMVNVNSILYISAGWKGNIYKTYGTYVQKVVDFSDYLSGYPQYSVAVTAMVAIQSRLYFALYGDYSAASVPPDDQISGLYSINLDAGSPAQDFQPQPDAYCMDYVSSGGYGVKTGGLAAVATTGSYPGIQWPVWGWYNPNASGTPSYGIDTVGTAGFIGPARATGYVAMLASEVYVVGDSNDPRTFEKCLVTFAKPLAVGQGIQLAFRREDVEPETLTFTTVDFATYGAILYCDIPVNVENAALIQVYMKMTAAGGQLSYDAPEVRQIKIY